jgi:hypothetical protein
MLLGSLLFVAGGVWIAPREPLTGYSCIIFFGLCAVIGAINLHPKSSYLVLTHEGFTFSSLFRKTFVPWSKVQSILPVRVALTQMVGLNFTPEFWTSAKTVRKVNTALSGAEGALPDTYGMSATDLSALMNELWVRYGSTAP